MCFDSSSSSSSETSTSTTNTDARVVGGDQSTNISAAGSTITVTDANAVNRAFGFAGEALQNVLGVVKDSEQRVSDAYSTAKAGEQRVLVGVGLAVVAVVAVSAIKRG